MRRVLFSAQQSAADRDRTDRMRRNQSDLLVGDEVRVKPPTDDPKTSWRADWQNPDDRFWICAVRRRPDSSETEFWLTQHWPPRVGDETDGFVRADIGRVR